MQLEFGTPIGNGILTTDTDAQAQARADRKGHDARAGRRRDGQPAATRSMKNSRSRAREFALQGLYQWLMSGTDPATICGQLAEATRSRSATPQFFDRMWQGVTTEYDILVSVDCAPLRPRCRATLADREERIGHRRVGTAAGPGVPYRVAINEAVELAKAYGGTDGHKFVNGVLDKLAAAARAPEVSAARA